MQTKMIWANLGTDDLERTRRFYTALGFKGNEAGGARSEEVISFSFGEKGFVVNFFRKDVLQKNTRSEISDLKGGNEVVFSLSAESREEVDAWVGVVRSAGGTVEVEPYEIGEGYTFVFSDPDGHRFNVLYWPGM